jgi:chaperonin GroES
VNPGIEPLDLKVLIRPDPPEEKRGSIILADVTKEREKFAATRGTLVSSGPNAFKEWGEGNAPEVGSKVLFAQYAGKRFKGDDGEEYVVMNDEDVIGVAR